jgi:membrane-bound serine protease (ClpP class)
VEVTDPTIVFLLIALGLAGIGIEILTPGGILPALVGVIAMILGVIGLLDIGSVTAGIGFIFLAVGFFIAATAFRDYRVLSVLGVVSLIAAGVFMFNRSTEPTSIPIVVIGAMVVGGFLMFVIERANLAKSEPIRSGPEHLIGTRAEVRESLNPGGQVFADGGLWQARLEGGDGRAGVGEGVTIVAIEGLTLLVRNNGGDMLEKSDESAGTVTGQEAAESGPAGSSDGEEG